MTLTRYALFGFSLALAFCPPSLAEEEGGFGSYLKEKKAAPGEANSEIVSPKKSKKEKRAKSSRNAPVVVQTANAPTATLNAAPNRRTKSGPRGCSDGSRCG